MNNNSVICKFINDHLDNWEELIASKGIKVRKDGDLACFKYNMYSKDLDWNDPISLESRGIIINYKTCEVVCWPFNKFFNIQEHWHDEIDWKTAQVQEKIDGSIIKLYYYNDKWNFATNEVIYAKDASTPGGGNFQEIIEKANNYNKIVGLINNDKLDKNKTYIFELVSTETRVVIDYGFTKLFHTGTRNNLTGIESNDDIGIDKPHVYPINSLEGALKAASELNKGSKEVTKEGFVVVDSRWHRVKIKSMDYVIAARAFEIKSLSLRKYLKVRDDLNNSKNELPYSLKAACIYYEFKLMELEYRIDDAIRYARLISEEYEYDYKAIAKIISNDELSRIMFRAIRDKDFTAKDGMKLLSITKLEQFIPDYKKYW